MCCSAVCLLLSLAPAERGDLTWPLWVCPVHPLNSFCGSPTTRLSLALKADRDMTYGVTHTHVHEHVHVELVYSFKIVCGCVFLHVFVMLLAYAYVHIRYVLL